MKSTLKYGKCDQPGCTTPEGLVIAKTLPSSGKWCFKCNAARLQQSKAMRSNTLRQKNDKLGRDRITKPMLTSLIKELDRVFSLYIRQRDANQQGVVRCCTCGTPHQWEDVDCGHWIPRGNFAIRWDERNCAAQCRRCNRYDEGELPKGRPQQFESYISSRWGDDAVAALQKLKHTDFKLDRNILEQLIKKYS